MKLSCSEINKMSFHKMTYRGLVFLLVLSFFWLNIFRPRPEILPPVLAVFWLDFIIMLSALILLLFIKFRLRVLLFVLFFSVLLTFPLLDAGLNNKITYIVRMVYFIFFLPVFFQIWFASNVSVPLFFARTIVLSAFPMAIVVFFQLFNFGLITEIIHWIWGTEKLRSINSLSPRVYGTFYNANWFGVYAVFLGICSLGLFRFNEISKWVLFCTVIVSIFFILVSGSRTAFLGASIAMTIGIFVVSIQTGLLRSLTVLLVLLLLGFLSFIFFQYYSDHALARRWVELFSGDGVATAQQRFETWEYSWSRIVENPWLGSGVTSIAHNSYMSTLQVFGIFVGGLIILFVLVLSFASFLLIKKKEAVIVIPVLMSFLAMANTAEFLYVTQIVFLVVPLLMWVFYSFFGRKFVFSHPAPLSFTIYRHR